MKNRLVLILASLLVTGCSGGVLDSQGPVSRAQTLILMNSVAIMLCVVVPVIVGTIAFAWWFRASNERAEYRPTWAYSGRLELIVWAIPLMVILLLGGITWIGSHDLDPYKPLESDQEPLDVQVISLDWKWLFVYPEDQVASVNKLYIPAGRPIHFHITSGSVMTAFFIPQLGSMIYSMNGMETQLHLQADNPGEYPGLASHYSGDGFSGMNFMTHAVSPENFENWVRDVRKDTTTLTTKAFKQLAMQDNDVDSKVYGRVIPNLFADLLSQKIPPADGPEPQPIPVSGSEEKGAQMDHPSGNHSSDMEQN